MAQDKTSFREILKQTAQNNSESLMKKAQLANRLAKITNGRNRRKAYRIKHQLLCSLIKNFPNRVRLSKDVKLTEFVVVELNCKTSGLHLPAGYLPEMEN